MTQPPPPESAEPPESAASVVEWGSPNWSEAPAGARWRDPRIAWALAGLGAVALFTSMVGEWTVTTLSWGGDEPERYLTRMANSSAWGVGWLVGGLALAVVVGLVLFGPAGLRSGARAVGLATAGAMLGLLTAACIDLSRSGVLYAYGWPTEVETNTTLERGLLVGYPAVALLAAALWLARPTPEASAAAAPERGATASYRPAPPPGPGGPGDLTVGPAEPFAHPTDEHEWR